MTKEISTDGLTVIRADHAWLASKFISQEETRYYLSGIFIEPHPEGGAYVVATDGHCMAVFRDKDAVVQKPCIVTIPPDIHLTFAKPRKSFYSHIELAENIKCVINHEDGSVTLGRVIKDKTFITPFLTAYGVIIDGKYPDWKKVLPADVKEASTRAAFNASYISRFAEVSKSSDMSAPVRLLVGDMDLPVIVKTGRDDFFGVIMPLKDDHERWRICKPERPDWLPQTPKVDAAA